MKYKVGDIVVIDNVRGLWGVASDKEAGSKHMIGRVVKILREENNFSFWYKVEYKGKEMELVWNESHLRRKDIVPLRPKPC